jgi:hypothetical protein
MKIAICGCLVVVMSGCAHPPAARPRSEHPPEKACVDQCGPQRLEEGKALRRAKRYEEALTVFLECADKNVPNIVGLLEEYPPARSALTELRNDARNRMIWSASDPFLRRWEKLNSTLGDYENTAEQFDAVSPTLPSADRDGVLGLVWSQLALSSKRRLVLGDDGFLDRRKRFWREKLASSLDEERESLLMVLHFAFALHFVAATEAGEREVAVRVLREWDRLGADRVELCVAQKSELSMAIRKLSKDRVERVLGVFREVSACAQATNPGS